MSSPRSLFSKTVSKKPRIDNEDKQEHTTSQNTGSNIPSTSIRKPAFNPSLLSSAFYTGPTMYGGAGACSSSPVTQYAKSKFYDRKKTDIKVTPSTPEPAMSQTSRRILELLEQYSSPISDAKRVPINNRPTFSAQKKPFNTSSIFDMSKKSLYDDSLTPNSSKAHRFRELQIPSMATLMKIKKNNLASGNAQAAITASMSSSLPYRPESYSLRSPKDNKTYKNKIKTKVSGRSNKVDEDEMALPVNLPNISLTMTGLPSFSVEPFRAPVSTTKPVSSDTHSFSGGNLSSNFKFTSPVAVSRLEMSPAATKFQFSEPLDIFSPDYVPSSSPEDKNTSDFGGSDRLNSIVHHKRSGLYSDTLSNMKKSTKTDFNSPLVNFKSGDSELTPKSSNKRPSEMWNGNDNWKNKSTLVNGDLKSSDIFGKNSFSKDDDTKSKDSSFNEILNPNVKKHKSDMVLPPSPISGLESLIKKQQEQWECSSCMTRNDQSKAKCVCCETARPGAAASGPALAPAAPAAAPAPAPAPAASKPLAVPVYSGMANFIKKQQDQWECSCCMTRNDPNRAKCVCCEASKPGCEPAPAAAVKFNFGNTQNTFKFGIDKANDPVKPPDITSESAKTDATVPTPNFLFGNPTTISNSKIDSAPTANFTFGATNGGSPANKINEITSPTSKPNLGFGIKKEETTSTPVVEGFAFGIKKTEENKVPVTATAPAEIKTNLFSFSSPKLANDTKTDTDSPKTFGSMQNDTNAIPTLLASKSEEIPATVTTSASSAPTFAFGVPQSTVKPAFGNSPAFQFGSSSATVPVTSAPDSGYSKPGLFLFGAKTPAVTAPSNTPSAELNVTPKPAFPLPSVTSPNSLFPSPTNAIKSTLPSSAGVIQFNATPAVDKPKEQAAAPFFGFSSPAANNSNQSTTFKSPSSTLPAFPFGSAATVKPEPSIPSLFNTPSAVSTPPSSIFGSKPAEPTTNLLFKSPTTTSSFAAPTSNIFGSTSNVNLQMTPSNMFGSGSLNSAATKPSVPIFGSADATSQQPQANSLFSNPTIPAPAFNSGSIFGNTAPSGNVPPPQTGGLFSNNKPPSDGGMFMNNPLPSAAPTNMFGSAMAAAAPSQTSSGMFGSSPAVPTPVFGASIPFGETSQNQVPQNVSFKFGASSSAAPSGIGFGQAPAPAPGVFSFGSGAAPGPSNSQFNFSMGAPASSFPAPGALTAPPQRRIKKAVRRNVR